MADEKAKLPNLLAQVKALLDAAAVAPAEGKRICQESKPQADIGWLLEFGIPDEFIPTADAHVLLRYGDMVVTMESVTDGLTYAEFQAQMAVKVKGDA